MANDCRNSCKLTWERLLGLTRNREYDYWISATENEKEVLEDKLYNMKDQSLKIKCNEDKISVLLNNDSKDFDVIIEPDPETKCLTAKLHSETCVHYISHLEPYEKEMEKGERVKLFYPEQLFDTLIKNKDIDFDPTESFLKFGKNADKEVTLTFSSRVTGGLFTSLIPNPYSGSYPTLNNFGHQFTHQNITTPA